MEIKNKIIIVTGASQGIGLETAKLLSKEGASVVLAARSKDVLKNLEKEISTGRNGAEVLVVPTDMRKEGDIENLIEKTIGKFGRIDVLINNAGQGMYGPVESADIDEYKNIMELNVYAPLRAMQLVIPIMRKQGGGMILNISSRVSKNYFPNLAAYASTKYALNALSLTARTELSKDNIVVSVMHPRLTATNFGKNSAGTGHPDLAAGQRPASAPRADIDKPKQVAEKIAELIKSEAPEAEMG
jgi:short-subunit dehydrogenase